jgi:hypothetical protein
MRLQSLSEDTHGSPTPRSKPTRPKDPQRSAIANGKLLPGIDQRSTWVRRCRELIEDQITDLGGEDNTSTAERSLIRRAATMTVELERLELKFATAGQATPDELDLYVRASGNLRRLLEAIGLKRRARDVTPRLSDYLAQEAAE